jgi:hypothetical protein
MSEGQGFGKIKTSQLSDHEKGRILDDLNC